MSAFEAVANRTIGLKQQNRVLAVRNRLSIIIRVAYKLRETAKDDRDEPRMLSIYACWSL